MCILKKLGKCKIKACIGEDVCALLSYYLEEQKADKRLLNELRKGSDAWQIVRRRVEVANEA